MLASLDRVLLSLMRQAEADAADYRRRRPGLRISSDTMYLDSHEMAEYRLPGSCDDVELMALRECYVLAFKTAVR